MAQGPKPPSAIHLLHRAGQRADSLFAHHIGDLHLTPRQFAVLQAVSEVNGLSQTAIMAATGIDRSSTADLVRRLVSNGLLQRRRTRRDARLYAVRLTPRGRETLSLGEPAVRSTDQALLSLIRPAQRSAFLEALTMIAANEAERRPATEKTPGR
jgi:DNA-binding MarR family transcriptional regulator